MNCDQAAAYLAGFIDAEGWISFSRPKNSNKYSRQIGFTNTSKELFDAAIGMADQLGLVFSVACVVHTNPRHSPRYNAVLIGGRAAFERFAAIVPILHPKKRANLGAMLKTFADLDAQGRQRSAPIYNADYIARRSEISRRAGVKRWHGHKTAKPRQRTPTAEQRERRNFLARKRRAKKVGGDHLVTIGDIRHRLVSS